ncbi:MAG: fused MFS/spermidine synthase [Pirellulales bacterium]
MPSRKVVIYVLFTLGGVSALVYEVMWMRSFRLVFGSSVQSASVILAAFFGGMAVGSWIGGRLAQRKNPLRIYGFAVLAVGMTALFVAVWLDIYRQGYPILYPSAGERPWAFMFVKLLLAAVALGPPTIAMGVTLPLAVAAIAPRPDELARATGLLYAVNVLGATAGAALASFALPMAIGIENGIYLATALNVSIGMAALAMSAFQVPATGRAAMGAANESPAAPAAADLSAGGATNAPHGSSAFTWIALAAVSGFASLALEVLYVRLLSFRTEGSVYSFGLMLVVFLLCLALGAAIVARLGDHVNLWRLFAFSQLAAMVGILVAPWLFEVASALTLGGEGGSLARHVVTLSLVSFVALGLPVVLAGVLLPATWKLAAQGGAGAGRNVGRLVAWNTLASVGGSLVTGFVLLPWLGFGGSLLFVAALYGTISLAGFVKGYRGVPRWAGCAVCAAIPLLWLAAGLWRSGGPPLNEGDKLVRYQDGAAASVAVLEHSNGHRTLRMNHNYTLGSSVSAARERRQGQLPLALHPLPKRVAFIGVATGITASAIKDFPVKRAVAIELVAEVNDAVADFAKWNLAIADDPRLELVVEDGRNYFLGTREQFDVIVSDLFIPWHAGSGDLYTVEHFRTVERCLAEGGIFAQWLPGYQLTVDELRTIVAGMQDVFPGVALWRSDFDERLPLVCVLGYKDGLQIDTAVLNQRCRQLGDKWASAASYLADPVGTSMLYLAGDAQLRAWSREAVRNTDDFPYIEYAAPRSYFRHRQQDVTEMNTALAGFRPRRWEYPESALVNESMDVPLRAADLLDNALAAQRENRFDREYACLTELIPLAGQVPAVVDHVLRAAARLRTRNHADRADELLETMCRQEPPALAALVALANVRQHDGQPQAAVALLTRAVEVSPDSAAIRMALVDLLKQTQQHPLLVEHLIYVLNRNADDPYLRLDLANALDRQGKVDEARQQIELFRQLKLRGDQRNVWRYLRGLGLGKYIDELPPPAAQAAGPSAAPTAP